MLAFPWTLLFLAVTSIAAHQGDDENAPLISCSTDEEDAAQKIKFYLYTRSNPDEPETIDILRLRALDNFNVAHPVKVIVHGWNTDNAGMRELKDAFVTSMNVNLFWVDWSAIDTVIYPWTLGNIPIVGCRLALFLDQLHTRLGIKLSDVHVIGHSLGAQMSGYAGKTVTYGPVGRITGLDPASVLISSVPGKHLDNSVAQFVDVIHSCSNIFSFSLSIGHVDFFPNGGICIQPGCTLTDLTLGTCSHNRPYYYFAESIRKGNSFRAFRCGGYRGAPELNATSTIMGLKTPTTARGNYCLTTNSDSPYALDPSQYVQQKKLLTTSDEKAQNEAIYNAFMRQRKR